MLRKLFFFFCNGGLRPSYDLLFWFGHAQLSDIHKGLFTLKYICLKGSRTRGQRWEMIYVKLVLCGCVHVRASLTLTGWGLCLVLHSSSFVYFTVIRAASMQKQRREPLLSKCPSARPDKELTPVFIKRNRHLWAIYKTLESSGMTCLKF